MSEKKLNRGGVSGTPPAGPLRWPEEQTVKPERKRILIVDDEASMTRLLKLNLEQSSDYMVRTENNPACALVAAEEFQPHLILLDVMMPHLDGGELASRFRLSSRLKSVPIVFLTAATTKQEVAETGGLIGGLPFLAKPVDMTEVLDCLRQRLGAG